MTPGARIVSAILFLALAVALAGLEFVLPSPPLLRPLSFAAAGLLALMALGHVLAWRRTPKRKGASR